MSLDVQHISALDLERCVADDASTRSRLRTTKHLADCALCAAQLQDLEAQHAAFLQKSPPDAFVENLRARGFGSSRRRRVTKFVLAVAGIAAVVAVAWVPRELERREQAAKARPTLPARMAVYRTRGTDVKLLDPESRIRSGDVLRIVLTRTKTGRMWIGAMDSNGRVDGLIKGRIVDVPIGEHSLPDSPVVQAPCTHSWLVAWDGEVNGQPHDPAPARGSLEDPRFPIGALVWPLTCE